MSTYTQIHIRQDPEIHPGNRDLKTESIMITIDGSGLSSVDISCSSIADMRRFARSILKICAEAYDDRILSGNCDFGMFSKEGNKAVYNALNWYGTSLDERHIPDIQKTVSDAGFPEVYDTVVREMIWNFLEVKKGLNR